MFVASWLVSAEHWWATLLLIIRLNPSRPVHHSYPSLSTKDESSLSAVNESVSSFAAAVGSVGHFGSLCVVPAASQNAIDRGAAPSNNWSSLYAWLAALMSVNATTASEHSEWSSSLTDWTLPYLQKISMIVSNKLHSILIPKNASSNSILCVDLN